MSALLEHGHTRWDGTKRNSPTYNTWVGMKRRRCDEGSHNYPEYGGRGIQMDDRWHDFAAFLADMGERPEGRTLDRKNSDGHYTKSNCRWATTSEQLLNRRNSCVVQFADGTAKPLMDVARAAGVPYQRLWSRVFKHGYTIERALATPSRTTA